MSEKGLFRIPNGRTLHTIPPDEDSAATIPAPNDLFGEWDFSQGSGTELTDISGNANHGTLCSGAEAPTWTATGLSFDGGDCVELPQNTHIEGSGTKYTVMIAASQSASGSLEFLWHYGDNTVSKDNGFRSNGFQYQYWGQQTGNLLWGTPPALDTPFVLTYIDDGSQITMYENDLAQTITGGTGGVSPAFGTHSLGRWGGSGFRWRGSMYYGALWDVELTTAQISQAYAYFKEQLAPRPVVLP